MPENLYRKWRPTSFSELAGQEHVATTLVNALATGRTTHAYLFSGPRGTGKTTSGRLLAKALNCTDRRNGEPCNRCASCKQYLEGRAMDLIELDAASNRGIDEIRSLRDKVGFHPTSGDYKVYLIDEVHMLTEPAFNALLKTLEEPPPHVVFVLATTEAHKVPATIASRCQRFDFHRVPVAAALGRLQEIAAAEGASCEAAGLELIARATTGSMRDAINLLDQLITSYGTTITTENVRTALGLIDDGRARSLARAAVTGELGAGLDLIASVRDDGLDLRQFQREVVQELRAQLLVKSGVEPPAGLAAEVKAELAAFVKELPAAAILTALRAFGEADLKSDPSSTLPLDLALADCALAPAAPPTSAAPPASSPRVAERPAPSRPAARPQPVERRAAEPPNRGDEARKAAPPASARPQPVEGRRAATGQAAPDLEAAQELIPTIYQLTRQRGIQTGALLNSGCDIIEATETEVVFGFRFENHAKKMQEPANLGVLTEAVREALGRDVSVRCVHDANVDQWQRRTPARSPLVRAAQEMGARVVAAKDEDEA